MHDGCCVALVNQLGEDSSVTKSSPTIGDCSGIFSEKKIHFTSDILLQKLSCIPCDELQEDQDSLASDASIEKTEETMKHVDSTFSDGSYTNYESEEKEEDCMNKICGICLEKFRVGEIVSWSCDENCGHVFHHECIRDWLLRRIGCPYCRTVVLPIDRPIEGKGLYNRSHLTQEELHQMATDRARFLTRTFYCVEEGLVILRAMKPLIKNPNEEATIEEDVVSMEESRRNMHLGFWKYGKDTKEKDLDQELLALERTPKRQIEYLVKNSIDISGNTEGVEESTGPHKDIYYDSEEDGDSKGLDSLNVSSSTICSRSESLEQAIDIEGGNI